MCKIGARRTSARDLPLHAHDMGPSEGASASSGDIVDFYVRLDLSVVADGCHARLDVMHICHICFESVPAGSLLLLPHPFAAADANLSGHRMCADCHERHRGKCPFCRSPPLAPPPKGFVGVWLPPADEVLHTARAKEAASARSRRASAVARFASQLLWLHKRSHGRASKRRSRAPSAPAMCRGCKYGCLQCDPNGDRMNLEDWEHVGLTGL